MIGFAKQGLMRMAQIYLWNSIAKEKNIFRGKKAL